MIEAKNDPWLDHACPYCGAPIRHVIWADQVECTNPDCEYVMYWDQWGNYYAKHRKEKLL